MKSNKIYQNINQLIFNKLMDIDLNNLYINKCGYMWEVYLYKFTLQDRNLLKEGDLNVNTVLDYFSYSIFYDEKSTNEQCKNQGIDFNINKESFKGCCEFVVDQSKLTKANNDLIIIKKQYRKDKITVVPISYYYVFKGVIYQAPSFSNVLNNNIKNISNNLLDVLNEL